MLSPTKTIRLPKRVVFYDSESEVQIEITNEEIKRAERNSKAIKKEPVKKEHRPYAILADFIKLKDGEITRERSVTYNAHEVKGKPWTGGSDTFCADFWRDVAGFTTTGERVYVFAHNAKYDTQVTGGVAYLVRLGYEVTAFSDSNPFFLELVKYITHSPMTGKPYGEIVDESEVPELKEGQEWHPLKKPIDMGGGRWFIPAPKARTIILLSSTNYYQQSLKQLGKVFKLPKLDFNHDEDFTQEKALIYAKRDVEILRAAMLSFIRFIIKEGLGSFSITVAGQSFGAYRHRFMPIDTIYIHSDERALAVEREAYAGGRTECFRIGQVEGRAYYVDVNSMYPAAMLKEIYPVELKTFWDKATINQLTDALNNGLLICCECLIKTDIPVFHKKQERLIFPTGEYWTALSTPEIKYALQHGLLKEIKNVAVYRGERIFINYVDYFYSMRLEAKELKDKIHDFLYKMFLNNLYGKFGQRNIKWEPVADTDPERIDYITMRDADTKEINTYKVFGGKVWKRNDEEDSHEAFNSFPAIAAHVTAYARMALWDAIEKAGIKNVYYMDTDSLMLNDEGYQNLWLNDFLDNGELGKLKLEDYGEVELHGCKDYVFTSEVERDAEGEPLITTKIKGISKNAVPLENSPEGKLRFAVTQWGGFTDRLKDKDFNSYYNKVLIKELSRNYNKGHVVDGVVIPYELNEIEEKRQALNEGDPDYLLKLFQLNGIIERPENKDKHFESFNELPELIQLKYFRYGRGLQIAEWCGLAGINENELFHLIINYELNKTIN